MVRKTKEPPMPVTATAPATKPVRVDLAPDEHRLLRLAAADAEMSMAAFARLMLVRALTPQRGKS